VYPLNLPRSELVAQGSLALLEDGLLRHRIVSILPETLAQRHHSSSLRHSQLQRRDAGLQVAS
jgi:hypothetical protein